MERDMRIILSAILILLLSMIIFNVFNFNTITGLYMYSENPKIYLDISGPLPSSTILGSNTCDLTSIQDSLICDLSLKLNEKSSYYIRSLASDTNWKVEWIKVSSEKGVILSDFKCNKVKNCEIKVSTPLRGQIYRIETKIKKLNKNLNVEYKRRDKYKLEARASQLPVATKGYPDLVVYAVDSNGWVVKSRKCSSGLNSALGCFVNLDLAKGFSYKMKADTGNAWKIDYIRLKKESNGKIIQTSYCDNQIESCEFSIAIPNR